MIPKVYKFLFKFFNFLCILSINFDRKRFFSPKILQFKSFFIVLILMFHYVKNLYYSVERIINEPDASKISTFSLYFIDFLFTALVILVNFWILILVRSQKNISRVFSIFFELINFCDQVKFKIEFKRVKFKILISLCLYSYFNFICGAYVLRESKLDAISIFSFISYLFFQFFYSWSFCLFYLFLVHYEFMLENFNEILQNQINFVHNNCEDLLNVLFKIRHLFKLLSKIFGVIFSLNVITEFLLVIFCVSFQTNL